MWDFFTELNDFEIYGFVLRTYALSENRLCSAFNFNVYSAFNQKNVIQIRWIKIDIRFGLLLASTGLLKGKNCSTHWLFAKEFRTIFPDVILTDDKITAYQSFIYSSGGITSYYNLLLYLSEKYTNREMAIMASKFFLLEMNQNT